MKPIRIFRHVACEGPGYVGEFLQRRGVPWELVCIDENQAVPSELDGVSGLIFMGAITSVNEPLAWIGEELRLIRRAVDQGVPVMGVCFGGQLLSKALGGQVTRGPGMEIGWHQVRRTDDPQGDHWLNGLGRELLAFSWHGDTFSVPPRAGLLLRSTCYGNQAFALDDHLAMQFHLEMTERMVNGWLSHYGSDLERRSGCIQAKERILLGLQDKLRELHRVADVIYGNWVARVVCRRAG